MNIGELLHKLRKDRKMTLLDLSRRSGVALATLSRMENGIMTGTLKSHVNICRALDVSLPDLYKDLVSPSRQTELRSHKRSAELSPHDRRVSSELLVSNSSSKKMVPSMEIIKYRGSSHPETARPGTEKFIYVIEGRLRAVIDSEQYDLVKGDTLYFEASAGHHFINSGSSEAKFLSVSSQQIS